MEEIEVKFVKLGLALRKVPCISAPNKEKKT
jgi:hypothetical protein